MIMDFISPEIVVTIMTIQCIDTLSFCIEHDLATLWLFDILLPFKGGHNPVTSRGIGE